MCLTIKETLVGENVTSALCESSQPNNILDIVNLSNPESTVITPYRITMIWICPVYSIRGVDSICNHYSPIYFLIHEQNRIQFISRPTHSS